MPSALMLNNTTGVSFPAGILTVYGRDSGYVGHAQLSGLANQDTRLASFASDRKVTITDDSRPIDEIVEAKAVDGLLRVTQKSRLVTRYTVSGALDGGRAVVVEHPVRPGWTFSSPENDGKTATHYRLKAVVGKGEKKILQAVDEQLRRETYAIVDAAPDMLLGWSASSPEKALSAKLVQLAEARKQDRERLLEEQERIGQNLGAVPTNSDLGTRYLKQLEISENEIRVLAARHVTLEEVQRLAAQVRHVLRNL